MPELGLPQYRLLLAACVVLAGAHAYCKLSPYFAITWFGSGLVFGYCWSGGQGQPENVLLPVLVVYLAAAATKGLVETRRGVAGNHLVHVALTGVFAGVLAAPFEAVAARLGWPGPRPPAGAPLDGPAAGRGGALLDEPAAWLGGVTLGALVAWMLAGACFYGAYKLLDHVGLGRAIQTVALFATMPLVAAAARWAAALP